MDNVALAVSCPYCDLFVDGIDEDDCRKIWDSHVPKCFHTIRLLHLSLILSRVLRSH